MDKESFETAPEDLDVRKPAARMRRAAAARSRTSIVATSELLGGVANASAEAFRSLNAALTSEAVARAGLRASLRNGARDGTARFFEELSCTSRRVFDVLSPETRAKEREPAEDADLESTASRLDYERLARLVAAEMSGHSSGSAATEGLSSADRPPT